MAEPWSPGEGIAAYRLQAARELRENQELILRGEPPYDISVRWKPREGQGAGE